MVEWIDEVDDEDAQPDDTEGRSPREYSFAIAAKDADDDDARLARQWGCMAWGRGGTRNGLYGLFGDDTMQSPFGDPAVTVVRIHKRGLSPVTSQAVIQDFVHACAMADAGGMFAVDESTISEVERVGLALADAAMDLANALMTAADELGPRWAAASERLHERVKQFYAVLFPDKSA